MRVERGIVIQDAPLELPDRGAWLEAELVLQRSPAVLVNVERVGLPSRQRHDPVAARRRDELAHQRAADGARRADDRRAVTSVRIHRAARDCRPE